MVVCEVLFLPSYCAYPSFFSLPSGLNFLPFLLKKLPAVLARKGLLGGRKDAGGSAQPPLLSRISCSPQSLAKELIFYKWVFCLQEELPI